MTDAERIAALEDRIERLERENALFKFQWLDRNTYTNYRPATVCPPIIGNGGIPIPE